MHPKIAERIADNYINESQKNTPDLSTSWGKRFPLATKEDKEAMRDAIIKELELRGASKL